MERDKVFEGELNTKKFQYHWIIGDRLIGLSKGKYYYLDSNKKWIKYSNIVPMKQQPKLFEDSTYISFADCHGEWGEQYISIIKVLNRYILPKLHVQILFKKKAINTIYYLILVMVWGVLN